MGEIRRGSTGRRRLERQAAPPLPRMGLGFLVGAGISLLVLASSADGMLWKYSEEREQLRARAALTEGQIDEMAQKLRALERENAYLRDLLRRGVIEPDPVAPDGGADAAEAGADGPAGARR